MSQADHLLVSYHDMQRLRKRYDEAVKHHENHFTCSIGGKEDAEFYTPYAKYLLEYLESKKWKHTE